MVTFPRKCARSRARVWLATFQTGSTYQKRTACIFFPNKRTLLVAGGMEPMTWGWRDIPGPWFVDRTDDEYEQSTYENSMHVRTSLLGRFISCSLMDTNTTARQVGCCARNGQSHGCRGLRQRSKPHRVSPGLCSNNSRRLKFNQRSFDRFHQQLPADVPESFFHSSNFDHRR